MNHLFAHLSKVKIFLDRFNGSFASDVFKLVGGTAFAQALIILSSPIITRLYGPNAFGIAALFLSIISIISVNACLRFEVAIMLPKRDEEAANLLGLSLLIAAITTTLLIPFLWLGQDPLLQLLNAQELAPYLWLVPISVFLNGVFQALNYWNSRTKRFWRLSVARINASISNVGMQIGAGLAGYSSAGSIIGAGILGSGVSTLILGGQIWRDDHKILRQTICSEGMLNVSKRYRKFPMLDTLSALMATVSWQIPVFLFAFYFTPAIVGFYALNRSVLQFPLSFIGSSISQVFFQRASDAKSKEILAYLVENIFRILVLLSLFPMLIITLMGKDLFILIFGLAWAEAGVYAQILGLWTFAWFISTPMLTILATVLERQEIGLIINVINFITRFLAIGIGGLLGDPKISLFLFAISGILVYISIVIATFKYTNISIKKASDIVLLDLRSCALPCIIIIALKIFGVNLLIQVVILCVLTIVHYISLKNDPLIAKYLDNMAEKYNH